MLWDDFEAGTSGGVIQNVPAKIGSWDSGAGSTSVHYGTDRPRTGAKSSKHDFVSSYNASLSKNGSFPLLYMDFWVRPEPLGGMSRNWKVWRLYGNNDQYQVQTLYLCNGELTTVEDTATGFSSTWWGSVSYTPAAWQHVQVVYKQSSPGVADGTVRSLVNSVPVGANTGNAGTRGSGSGSVAEQIRIGHYWAQDGVTDCAANPGANVYVDDVYIDTSWARVELGDKATYAASTHREILIPSAWSDNQLQVTIPATTFAAGSQVYLFVTDANNVTQSAGTPVTVGGSATAPKPPGAVVVN
jgi:hypothetical protein